MYECLRHLVVQQNVWLREEGYETVREFERLRNGSSIVCSTTTPAKQHIAGLKVTPNVGDRVWHRDLLRTDGPDEGVVYVDIDGRRTVQWVMQGVVIILQRPDNNPFTG